MRTLQSVDRAIVRASKGLSWVSVACIIVMGFLSAADIISTKVFGRAIPVQSELIQYLMVPVFCCFLANLQLTKGIMAVDLFSHRYSKTGMKIISTISNVLGAAVYGFAAVKSFDLFKTYLVKKTASSMSASSFVLWPFALILSICLLLFALAFLWCVIRDFALDREENATSNDVDHAEEVE